MNLLREGVPKEKIFLVGDIMVDSLLFNLERAKQTDILDRLGLRRAVASGTSNATGAEDVAAVGAGSETLPYALLTLHRPANVDDPAAFGRIVAGLRQVAARIPILFPVHPRTLKQIAAFGLEESFVFHPPTGARIWEGGIHCFEPLGYLDFLNLMAHARLVPSP